MKEEVISFSQNILSAFTTLLPKLILAGFILLSGYILARILEKLVKRLIIYLNESLNTKLQSRLLNVDLKASALFLSKIIFWIIMLLTFLFCLQILNIDFHSYWFDRFMGYLPNVLVAAIIVFFGIIAGRLIGDLIKSAAARTGLANGSYMGKAVGTFVLFVSIVVALDQLGINIGFLTNLFIIVLTSLLFGASLAFGLGARTSVSNILGSYYVRKTFELGERIKMGELEGIIIKINDHAIVIESKDGLVFIPAKDFNESNVTIIKSE